MKRIIAILTLALMLFGMTGCDFLEADDKTFEKGEFSITLNEDFKKIGSEEYEEYEGYYVCYKTNYVHVLVLREAFEDYDVLEDMTLDEYIELSLEANGFEDHPLKDGDGYQYITYTEMEDGELMYYMVAYYEGSDGFYAVNFVTPNDNVDKYKKSFTKWAESVEIG